MRVRASLLPRPLCGFDERADGWGRLGWAFGRGKMAPSEAIQAVGISVQRRAPSKTNITDSNRIKAKVAWALVAKLGLWADIWIMDKKSDFTTAFNYTLKYEGSWANDPDDPGGPTMFGITLNTAKSYGINEPEALKKISLETAAAILREGYWRFDTISDQRVATKLFDMAVNMGLGKAVKYLQMSLNVYGAELRVDGVFGAETSRAANSCDPELILDLLCGVSREHYESAARRSPSSKKFLPGWLRRAEMRPP